MSSLNDSDTKIVKYTDAQGNLVFTADEIDVYKRQDAITTLLKNRMKYVSGGQSMKVDTFNGKEILSSVRYEMCIRDSSRPHQWC